MAEYLRVASTIVGKGGEEGKEGRGGKGEKGRVGGFVVRGDVRKVGKRGEEKKKRKT